MNKDVQLIWEAYIVEGTAPAALEWLGQIEAKGYQLMGHQTYVDVADGIVRKREGFDGGPNLGGTATLLSARTGSLEFHLKAQKEKADLSLDVPDRRVVGVHRDSDAIVILVVPGKFKRPDEVSEAIMDASLEERHRGTALPDNYIAGYFDSPSENFIANGRFNPTKGILS